MRGDSRAKGRGFESQRWIVDGRDIFTHLLQKLYCLFEKKPKINEKEARDGPFF